MNFILLNRRNCLKHTKFTETFVVFLAIYQKLRHVKNYISKMFIYLI